VTGKKRKQDDEQAEAVLSALGHSLRRRILRLLLGDDEATSPTQAAGRLDAPLSHVSYHFRVLARAKALKKTGERPVRGSVQHFYRVNPAVAEMPMVTEVLAATSNDDR
jgi:DNA-binding transcriptional ArsR family regulator